MASGEIFDIATKAPNSSELLRLKFNYQHPDVNPTDISFVLLVGTKTHNCEVRSDVNLLLGIVSLNMLATSAAPIACLVACAGSTLAKLLVECFDKDVSQYVACLQSKGVNTAGDLVACATACYLAGGAP